MPHRKQIVTPKRTFMPARCPSPVLPIRVVTSLVLLLKYPSRRTLLPALLLALCSAACQAELDTPMITQPIVNGAEDSSNLYPYVDRLVLSSPNAPTLLCSGVLIGARTVLTSAHCIPPAPVTAQFSGTNGTRRLVTRTIVHPEYRGPNMDDQHDMAAVFLDEAASGHPVGLEYFSAERQLMTFVGLGKTSLAENAPTPDERRRYITIDVGPRDGGSYLSGTHPSQSVAPGDSGGALLKNGRLVGVTSTVRKSDDSVRSSAIPVFRHRDWILERLFENRDGAPIYWSSGRMSKSEALFRGDSLYSGNRFVRLTLQFNGDLVLTQGTRDVWRSGTAGSGAFSATMQRDGNLVLYNALGNVVWALNRFDSSGDPTLAVQNDGNLVQYSATGAVYWAANTNLAGPAGCRRLTNDRALHRGNSLYSCGGQFRLTMQPDGNLVLYYPAPISGTESRWSSGTFGTTGYLATMQPDGNFVVYNLADSPVWSTGTVHNPGAMLDVQNDGNIVVYPPGGGTALWASGSTLPAPTGCGGMGYGQALSAGQSLHSCNGRLRLTMQTDGNLVLYANGTANGTVALWASNTYGSGGYVATVQPDGNFVVYGMPDDGPRWATGTNERWSHLSLHDDGELVLYAGMFPMWSSRTTLPPCAVTCGTRCCPTGSWCGTGSRCCTSCTAGCPCFGSELSLTPSPPASRCPLDGSTLAAGEEAEPSCAIESAPAQE